MSARDKLKRALSAIDDAISALGRVRQSNDPDAAHNARRALSELDDAAGKIKQALRDLPDGV